MWCNTCVSIAFLYWWQWSNFGYLCCTKENTDYCACYWRYAPGSDFRFKNPKTKYPTNTPNFLESMNWKPGVLLTKMREFYFVGWKKCKFKALSWFLLVFKIITSCVHCKTKPQIKRQLWYKRLPGKGNLVM